MCDVDDARGEAALVLILESKLAMVRDVSLKKKVVCWLV